MLERACGWSQAIGLYLGDYLVKTYRVMLGERRCRLVRFTAWGGIESGPAGDGGTGLLAMTILAVTCRGGLSRRNRMKAEAFAC
jgi:hypothetical protein